MEKLKNTKYPSIASSNILTEEEMKNALGGGCKSGCKETCKEGCSQENKSGGGNEEEDARD